ncbi:hypothetical protein [Sphingomonas sp. GV3]|uniref:hypothetical protein n=1 Tax=Sphingomonas sp. GV3 TaxID=3040671 RepID=UPI00280B3A90|nr:hypothetical protein [Sphingomonas sp. GV3]
MKRGLVALLALGGGMVVATAAAAQLSINISVGSPPPPLPVYTQPALPGPDYVWTPGYWAWDDIEYAYYWVPGTWVMAPRPGLLWTPPWWGWSDGAYVFHAGYWGPHVGFYGGVPYGFGYTGAGYQGGYWNGGHIFYNRAVTTITNVHITNVYRQDVVVNRITRVSYNGGPGGVQARPSRQDWIAAHEAHVAPTQNQFAHFTAARGDPRLFATANHGHPPIVATARPLMAGRQPFADPRRGGWQPSGAPLHGNAPSTLPTAYRAPHAPQLGGASAQEQAQAFARAPMPVVHRGGPPPWQRDTAPGAAPASPPFHAPPPQWHGAVPQARGYGGEGMRDRPGPAPHGEWATQGGRAWASPPHGAPPPRVAFHAPPPRPGAPPHPPRGGGGDHHGHHG